MKAIVTGAAPGVGILGQAGPTGPVPVVGPAAQQSKEASRGWTQVKAQGSWEAEAQEGRDCGEGPCSD